MTTWRKAVTKYNKFSNERRMSRDGRSFHSQSEAGRYEELKLLERAGQIKDLKCQVSVKLSKAKIELIVDYKYFDIKLNEEVFEEFKGFETPEWRIKRRLWKSYGPGLLRVMRRTGGDNPRYFLAEEIRGGTSD